jgi:hypothetical protein
MDHGRWYPTVIALSDGRALVISGHTDASDPTPDSNGQPRHNNHSMEVFNTSPTPGGYMSSKLYASCTVHGIFRLYSDIIKVD